MLPRLYFIIKHFLYWIAFFIFAKLAFLVYQHQQSFKHFDLWDDIVANGLRLDVSAAAYFILPIVLIGFIGVLLPGNWVLKLSKTITLVLVAAVSLLLVSDMPLYTEWGFRLDATPILYLKNPQEAFASASIWLIARQLFLGASFIWFWTFIYRLAFNSKIVVKLQQIWQSTILFLFLLPLLVIPIRGGIGPATIDTGSAYFHQVSFVNHAALNLPWNIAYSFSNLQSETNPYSFMDEGSAIEKAGSYYGKPNGERMQVLQGSKPNILLIILESFTAKAVGHLNGLYQVTPQLDSLAKKGICFTNFYSSAERSDRGIVSLLSAYPSQPAESIIKYPNKTQSLDFLPKALKELGYQTAFYYGGDVGFANFKSFLTNANFDILQDQDAFSLAQRSSKWGVPDHILFDHIYDEIAKADTPYFKAVFTLSSHPPYDVPMEAVIEGSDIASMFCNSIYYTDKSLGNFIQKLETSGQLENTLVIITADHGSFHLGDYAYNDWQNYHIPMVWYGGPVTKPGLKIEKYAGQTDLAASLFNQLGMPCNDFSFSRDILDSNFSDLSYYTFTNGFGHVEKGQKFKYVRESDSFTQMQGSANDSLRQNGKAYYQVLFDDMLQRGKGKKDAQAE